MNAHVTDASTSKIYAIELTSSSKRRKYTPEILPFKVHHNGSVNATHRYWQPTEDTVGPKRAYFRGRELRGRSLKLPEGYRGIKRNLVSLALVTDAHSSRPRHP